METFKTILRIVFATASVLCVLVAIHNVSHLEGEARFFGMLLFYANLFMLPLFVAFIVILYSCIFKKKHISFFKTELIYLLIQIGTIVLLQLSYINCPDCPG